MASGPKKKKKCRKCKNKGVTAPMVTKTIMVQMKGSPSKRLRPKQILVPVEQSLVEPGGSESVS